MATLITGSYAFDTIMGFPDSFKNHIIPEKLDILNVCFLVPEMRKEFGGCSGNIAYNLNLLGGNPLPMATVGEDFGPYRKWLTKCNIDDKHVVEVADSYTAQAFLTTDENGNQIIAFHPGAMNVAETNKISDAENIDMGIVSPDGRQAMIDHAEQFSQAGIPFFFDPGQGLPMFGEPELKRFIQLAEYVVVNDYESEMLSQNSAMSLAEIAAQVSALIVTRGSKGADIFTSGERIAIPVAPISANTDPTGCGDAFRAGLLHGVNNNLDWQTTGQMAALLGAIKIEQHGTQNHHFTLEEFKQRYHSSFNQTLAI
ncbi:MAG: adenosine kinase [Saprospiraceae bacterium]